ncbi:DUF7311 family protein [Natrarchaeobius chitinivorans]|uniref:DUF7311 domain-containing protein n=1 Tax=Natrarchaeobius chitinivorans TaxID=1679083 RepID=A0A3N6M5W2_NATCH|nr:hypothetical protein [Natrarchaeobius chitinivorans]RQG90691.1 hypothetical protein EA473_20500 [Natrarchaeobius chitinivorans]
MIRYVLAVLLAVALVSLSVPAIEHGATVKSEHTVDRDVAAIDRAATSLVAHEDLPPDGHPPPQRIVTVTLPTDSVTTTPIERFEIERAGAYASVVTVSLEGTSPRTFVIDAPIVYATPSENRSVDLGGTGTDVELLFQLAEDPAGTEVVVVTRN